MSVDLLKVIKSRHRQFINQPWHDPQYAHHFPYFHLGTVDIMLRDSRIKYGLALIKGPVYAYTKFFTTEEAEDPAVNQSIIDLEYHFSYKIVTKDKATEEFVIKNLNAFWQEGLLKALTAVEWGYSCSQVVWKRDKQGFINYDRLIAYPVRHVKPVVQNHSHVGIYLHRIKEYIPIPKSFIHIHQRENDQYAGDSRLRGAHIPWHTQWALGGQRDIINTWFFRNAYDGGTLYVPAGSTLDPETGVEMSNTELGAKIMENSHTGSYRILTKPDGASKKQDPHSWEYEAPKAHTTPQGMLENKQDARIEVLEGMGIPPEVVENASSQGLGSASGRKIPLLAFYATLAPIANEMIRDVKHQILLPAVRVNGLDEEFEIQRIIPKSYESQAPIEGFDQNADMTTPNDERTG